MEVLNLVVEEGTLSHGHLLVPEVVVVAFPLLKFFRESLVSQHLLLLEDLLSETNFNLDVSLFVDNAAFGPTVVHEELLVPYENRFSFLHEADEPAEEVGLDEVIQ